MNRIPFLSPTFPEPEAVAETYAEIVKSGVFSNGGPKEQEFASELARRVGNEVAVAVVASGTAALQLACRAVLRPDRSAVLVPSFTFAAVPLALLWCGYRPVFFDIDPHSWQGSLAAIEGSLAGDPGRYAGIVLTNTFGVANPEIEDWEKLALRNSLPLVIDSAAGFGATYPWAEPLGARGDCEIFSFHATKVLAIGEGGAVMSRDPEVIRRVAQLRNFGLDGPEVVAAGTNAKLSELASAVGILQLRRLDDRLAARRRLVARYEAAMSVLGFTFQPALASAAVPFVSAACVSSAARGALVGALDRADIECRTYYDPPIHRHRLFTECDTVGLLPATDDLATRIVSLPLADSLPDGVVDRIVEIASMQS